jgi:hypothetical protein
MVANFGYQVYIDVAQSKKNKSPTQSKSILESENGIEEAYGCYTF